MSIETPDRQDGPTELVEGADGELIERLSGGARLRVFTVGAGEGHLERGRIHDRLGRYENAWQDFLAAEREVLVAQRGVPEARDRLRAVVLAGAPDDPETTDRDDAYARAGWQARRAGDWSVAELIARIRAGAGDRGEDR